MAEDIEADRAAREPTRAAPPPTDPAAAAIADPAPLGLAAFALTTFVLSMFSFWAYVTFFATSIPAANRGSAVGLYLIAWGIFTAYMWVASLRTTAAVSLVFLLLTVTFVVLGIGDAAGNDSISKLGGWFGLATAVAAWYASFAGVTNFTFKREVLPVRALRRA
jgi:succinate-acetate transporter protein